MNAEGQVNVLEAIIVGVMVFVAVALTAIFRLPTTPSTFQQTELERLGVDALLALAAKPPSPTADCNEPAGSCPFKSELERMLSLALRFEGATLSAGEPRDTDPFADYLAQALPEGTRYLLTYFNGVNNTIVHPLGVVPPALDVVVSRSIVSPPWTSYSANLSESALIRIGEITGFTDATTDKIYDPLNRQTEEWGRTHKSLLSDVSGTQRVPSSALYGTYRLCPAAGPCTYFTIVPSGVFGAGSPILHGDRDNSSSISTLGPFFSRAKFVDDNPADDLLSPAELFYLDLTSLALNQVDVGDLRLNQTVNCTGAGTPTCPAGSMVATGDADIGKTLEAFTGVPPFLRPLLGDNDGTLDEGEYVYLDVSTTPADKVSAGDRRFHRVGTLKFGSVVAAGDMDAGKDFVGIPGVFSSLTLRWADADSDGVVDPTEAVYLDLAGNGQIDGLETLDIHLNPKGSPTVRYFYDVKLVVWFGV